MLTSTACDGFKCWQGKNLSLVHII